MRIRPATSDDAEGLSRLAAVTFPLACTPRTPAETIAEHVATRLDPDSFRRHLADPRCVLLLVEGGTADPVAYSMLLLGEPDDPDVAVAVRIRPTVALERFYVHPDHHGDGLAGHLMTATLEAAVATGAAGAWLGVSEENGRANAFYARHGLEPVGSKRFHIGEVWEQDVVRERPLGSG